MKTGSYGPVFLRSFIFENQKTGLEKRPDCGPVRSFCGPRTGPAKTTFFLHLYIASFNLMPGDSPPARHRHCVGFHRSVYITDRPIIGRLLFTSAFIRFPCKYVTTRLDHVTDTSLFVYYLFNRTILYFPSLVSP